MLICQEISTTSQGVRMPNLCHITGTSLWPCSAQVWEKQICPGTFKNKKNNNVFVLLELFIEIEMVENIKDFILT